MTSSRLELATARHPSLRPSMPERSIIAALTYQAPCTTIAREAALLLVDSSPSRWIEWPWPPAYKVPVRYAPADVAFERGSLEKCSSQPVWAGSEPRPCATRCERTPPVARFTRWNRAAREGSEKSATPMKSRCAMLSRCRSRASRARSSSLGATFVFSDPAAGVGSRTARANAPGDRAAQQPPTKKRRENTKTGNSSTVKLRWTPIIARSSRVCHVSHDLRAVPVAGFFGHGGAGRLRTVLGRESLCLY